MPTPTPTPAAGDFSVSLSPNSLTASPGSSPATETVTLTYTGGFNASVTITAAPPAGVTCVNSCTDTLFGSTVANFNFVVGNGVPLGTQSLGITASGGGISHSTTLSLLVQPPPAIVPNRSQWVRTDDSPSDIVFDHARKLVYTANRLMNRVEVISPANATILKTIPVPKAIGLDITPDGNSLYVATEVQQLYKIDLNTQQVVDRIQFSGTTIGHAAPPFPDQPVTLANGKVLVRVGCGRINPCTTETDLFEFDPTTRTFTDVTPTDIQGRVGLMARSADHQKVLISSSDSGGNLDLFDSTSNSAVVHTSYFGNFVGPIASKADGSQFAFTLDCCQLVIVDGNVSQLFTRTNNSAFLEGGIIYSQDGSTLYVPETSSLPVIDVIDTATFTQVGQIPDLKLDGFPMRPVITAMTDDEMLLGKAERGLSLVDGNVPPSVLPATAPTLGFESQGAVQPSHIVAGNTATTLGGSGFLFTPQIFFGLQQGTSVSYANGGLVNVTAPPPVSPDVVLVRAIFPGGYFTLAPDGYTYAPKARFQTVTAGTIAGGTALEIIGYGLAYNQSQLSVTVGGQPATITHISSFSGISPFSLPIHRLDIVTPPAASAADTSIVINTPDGSTNVPYQYVSKQVVPVQGQANQLVFDQSRGRVYWSNTTNNRVDVLNLSTSQLSSFPTGLQPVGLAMTPDGTRLLTANFGDKTVSIIDPDQITPTKTVSVATSDTTIAPLEVATLANGTAFIGMVPNNGNNGCVGVLRQIDLTTFNVTTRTLPSCLTESFLMVASGEGTEAFVGSFLWKQSSDAFSTSILSDSSSRAASFSGNAFASGMFLTDNQLLESDVADWPELLECSFCTFAGEKLHSSGSLLYAAFANGNGPDKIQMFDAHTGNLLRTIDMPELMAVALDNLAIDNTGSTLFALTQAGLVIIRISSVPLSLGFLDPGNGTSGTAITVHGSGFQAGATVTIGGQPATTTFVDANTLQVMAPALSPGPQQVLVANPAGDSYSLDAGYVAN
jgi:DNA-binding beta-propeller fold protein YncE